jgi:hypothetical protein
MSAKGKALEKTEFSLDCGLQGEEVLTCMEEIQRNIEREKDAQDQVKRCLRQQVLNRFYAHEDVDTDHQSGGLRRCSSSETLDGPGSSFNLNLELSEDCIGNRAAVTQALAKTAYAHKDLALRALSAHPSDQFRILLKGMRFEGLYAEQRKGVYRKVYGLKGTPESFSVREVSAAFCFSSGQYVGVDKWSTTVDAVVLYN